MNTSNATIAARLMSWHSYFTTEAFLNGTAVLPFDAEVDAILGDQPSWVTVDPVPDGVLADSGWDFDSLLTDARESGDPKLQYLADRCNDWQWRYMASMDKAEGIQ